jgi:beta-glucanase (GH16 family)
MFPKAFAAAALALSASRLASAQTFSECNPMEKTCPAADAFGKDGGNCDFTQGACDVIDELPGTTLSYEDDGAVFRIAKESNAPTVATHKRLFFGRVDVELKAAPGQGIVTSVVLESLTLDEIDWEWLGGDDTQVQSNYFGKGDTTTYDRGGFHGVHSPTTTFHTYSIEWTSKHVKWIIDGVEVRELLYADAKGGSRFPQTPMELKVGTWVAGRKDAPEGTVEWAGGYAEWEKAPFDAFYKSISVVDYAGGDGPTSESIKEYVYGDKSGSWESIRVVKGDGSSSGGDSDEDEDEVTTTSKPAPTTTAKPTTTEADESEETGDDNEDEDEETTTTSKPASTTTTEEEETSTTSTPEATTSTFVTTTPASTTAAPTTSGAATTPPSEEAPETTAPPEGAAGSLAASFGTLAFAGAVALYQLL